MIKLKISCALNDIIKKVKRQSRVWEKIFTSHILIYGKGLLARIYKELLQVNNKKTNDPI